ncbi:MAG: class I SAM-dependent methyltransferase [Candidatus Eisenbacteria bacterium]|nr:class I SAM-dependent methyltransferase [Candidatus Eisenbacteria bacterium]
MTVKDEQKRHYNLFYGKPGRLSWGSPSGSYENYRYAVWIMKLFERILREKGTRLSVLDLGCGDGKKILLLGQKYLKGEGRLFGIDISATAVRKAGEMNELLNREVKGFAVGESEGLPVRENSLDAVLCVELLEHTASPERALSEIHRILAPGGFAIIGTPNKSYIFERLGALLPGPIQAKLKQRRPKAEAELEEWTHMHPSEMGWGELKGVLRRTGFKIETARGTNWISQKQWLDDSPFLFGMSVIGDSLLNLFRLWPDFQWGVILLARAVK